MISGDKYYMSSNIKSIPSGIFKEIVERSVSIREALAKFGMKPSGSSYIAFKKRCHEDNLDLSQYMGQRSLLGKRFSKDVDIISMLTENSNFLPLAVKNRLIFEGLKEQKCERCGSEEWCGNPVPLELDHINGDNRDNRYENLRILCPNCHAQTITYRGRNKGDSKNKWFPLSDCNGFLLPNSIQKIILQADLTEVITRKRRREITYINCPICMKDMKNDQKYCSVICAHNAGRKFDWDSVNLVELIKSHSFCSLGRMFGVSDNAIRKQLKKQINGALGQDRTDGVIVNQ